MNAIELLSQKISKIEESLEYVFSDKNLLLLSFIHRSFFNEHQEIAPGHNERLEFLGDSVLGLIVAGYLYSHLPTGSEGHLSHLRSHLVGASSCALFTHQLQLEQYLLLGKGEMINLGRGRERILADLIEALIGAIYLDGGIEEAKSFFLKHFIKSVDNALDVPLRNWKAELQDYSQKKTQKPPEYQVLQEVGPAHSRSFLVAAFIEGKEVGQGEGASKKQAEANAAEDALRRLEREEL